jgi:alkylation response protein AidB-like acyl-CoA dehydrogenase
MDLELQDQERSRGRAFAARAIAASVARRDRESRWEHSTFPHLGDVGLLGAPLPREVGGAALSAAGFSGLLRGFAEGCGDAGLALAWAAHVGAALRIAAEGSAEQQRRLLPALARGEAVGAWARREAGRAGDPVGMATRAVARGDRWVLDGVKSWVVNGGLAAVLVVDAVTDPSRGKDGISTFLVGRDAAGLRVGKRHETSGLRTAVISELIFEGVEVGRDDRLGAEGAGCGDAARRARSRERVAGGAVWVGLMRALLDQTVARSRESVDLGRPLAHAQAARATLADLRIQIELAERLQARAAWRLDGADPTGVDAERDVAVASLFLARAVPWVTREAARLQGEAGVVPGHLAERSLRDAAVFAHLAGREEILRSAIAGSLLHLPPPPL